MSEVKNEKSLTDFSWDAENLDFFDQSPEKPAEPEVKKEVKKVKETPEEKKAKKKAEEEAKKKAEEAEKAKEELENTKFFETDEVDEVDIKKKDIKSDDKTTPKTTPKSDTVIDDDGQFFNVLSKGMKDNGVFSTVDIPEEDLEEKDFVGLLETEVDNRVQETFEGFFEELDDDAKSFLKFKKDGGDTRQFFAALQTSSSVPKGDLDDSVHQKAIARYYFKNVEGMDEADIDDRIQWLDDTGKTAKNAERYDAKIKIHMQKQEKALAKQTKDAIKEAEENAKSFTKSIKTVLKDVNDVNGFAFTSKDKKELIPYITEAEVKIGKNKFITGLQNDLRSLMGDHQKLILLAKLLKSDFDTSSIKTKEETKNTRKIKEDLARIKKSNKVTSGGGITRKDLSDFF